MLIQLYHIEAVGRDVVGGAAEGDEEEEAHGGLKPESRRQRERNACQCCSDERLHRKYPPALRLQQIDERAPQGFDHPGKRQPSCIETHFGIRESQLHIHHYRESCHDHVGQSLCKI